MMVTMFAPRKIFGGSGLNHPKCMNTTVLQFVPSIAEEGLVGDQHWDQEVEAREAGPRWSTLWGAGGAMAEVRPEESVELVAQYRALGEEDQDIIKRYVCR